MTVGAWFTGIFKELPDVGAGFGGFVSLMLAFRAQPARRSAFPSTQYRFRRMRIGYGDRSIDKTIVQMRALVLGPEGVGNPQVRIAALHAVRNAVRNINEIDAVLDFVKQNIQFRGEYAETLQSPLVTLQLRGGDCDDHSVLIAAMLASLGYDVNFRTIAASPSNPQEFSHVYAVVRDKRTGQWRALDSTVQSSYAGWEPPVQYRVKTYQGARGVLHGLGQGDESFEIPAAPQGLTPGQTAFYNIAAPLAQSFANAYAPPVPAPQPAVSSSSSSVLIWILILAGVVGVIWWVNK